MRDGHTAEMKSVREDVTLKDIAEAVGKSVAAVSRALNNYDDISQETRDHIKRVAREMGYAPTNSLGLILPFLSPRNSDPYFSELLAGITHEATTPGFDLLVSTCPPGPEETYAYLRLINSRRVDGIIVARPRWRDRRIELLLEKQFPFVVIGATNIQGDFLTVSTDATAGAKYAVEHVIEQGHERIALINTPSELFFSSDFLAGFREAMFKAGLPINDDFLEECDISQKEGYRVTQTLLSKPETPTAIIAADDIVALGVMAAIQDQGLEVGSDIVVTGYGDILLTEYSQPPLTTIHRSTYTLGQQACRLLTSQLLGEIKENKSIVFEPSLVIRQSSDLALWL
jgi:LacI family transcriptional regulator